MSNASERRINSALNVIDINKLELKLDLDILKDTKKFEDIKNMSKYKKTVEVLPSKNYDSKILELHRPLEMKSIMNNDKKIKSSLILLEIIKINYKTKLDFAPNMI